MAAMIFIQNHQHFTTGGCFKRFSITNNIIIFFTVCRVAKKKLKMDENTKAILGEKPFLTSLISDDTEITSF
jgi:hypothetical protein